MAIEFGNVHYGAFKKSEESGVERGYYVVSIWKDSKFLEDILFLYRKEDRTPLTYLYTADEEKYGTDLLKYVQDKIDKKDVIGLK